MKKIIPLFVLWLFGCEEPVARKPIYQSNTTHIQASVERNKKINKLQQNLIQKAIKKDSGQTYVSAPAGYWFKRLNTTNGQKPQPGDEVSFVYSIKTLTGETIYNELDLGEVTYLVDKEDLLPALRYAVKDLRVRETGVFFVPSFLGYGYQGDGDKIGINQPLQFTIKLLELKKQNHPLDSK